MKSLQSPEIKRAAASRAFAGRQQTPHDTYARVLHANYATTGSVAETGSRLVTRDWVVHGELNSFSEKCLQVS